MAKIANKFYIYFKIAAILQIISKLQSTPLTKTSEAHHFTELYKSLIFKLRAFWEGSCAYMVRSTEPYLIDYLVLDLLISLFSLTFAPSFGAPRVVAL